MRQHSVNFNRKLLEFSLHDHAQISCYAIVPAIVHSTVSVSRLSSLYWGRERARTAPLEHVCMELMSPSKKGKSHQISKIQERKRSSWAWRSCFHAMLCSGNMEIGRPERVNLFQTKKKWPNWATKSENSGSRPRSIPHTVLTLAPKAQAPRVTLGAGTACLEYPRCWVLKGTEALVGTQGAGTACLEYPRCWVLEGTEAVDPIAPNGR